MGVSIQTSDAPNVPKEWGIEEFLPLWYNLCVGSVWAPH